MHPTYKKIVIATLLIAPLTAHLAARFTEDNGAPAAESGVEDAVASPPANPSPPISQPAPMQYSALPGSPADTGPFDPRPTLDPSAIAAASPVGGGPSVITGAASVAPVAPPPSPPPSDSGQPPPRPSGPVVGIADAGPAF